MVNEFWRKLNANERLAATGAIVVFAAWLVGVVTGGGIGASWSFIAAIVVLAIYWLKYSPNQSINWPAPIPTIVLVVAGLAAVFAVLGLFTVLSALSLFGGFFLGLVVAIIANAIGAVMMALGAWREYQAMPKTAPPPPPPPPAA